MFGGVRIFESVHLTKPFEDWSQVRSPSRARRRMKKHKQRIRYLQVPDPNAYEINGAIVMHPETARKFRAELAARGI